jgi:hypothetical protein
MTSWPGPIPATPCPGPAAEPSTLDLEPVDLGSLRVAISEDLGFAPVDDGIRQTFRAAAARFRGVFARAEERDPPLDDSANEGVVEVRSAVQKILGPGSERESERQGARRRDRGRDALDRVAKIVNRSLRIAARILDRAADQARLGREPDGQRGRLGGMAEAVLEVGGHRQRRRLDDHPGVRQGLVARDPAIPAAEAEGAAGAGRGERPKPSPARMRAVPASNGLGMTKAPGLSCSARKVLALSFWLAVMGLPPVYGSIGSGQVGD